MFPKSNVNMKNNYDSPKIENKDSLFSELGKFTLQGVPCRMVLVVNFIEFSKLNIFALLLLYVTLCTMWRVYFPLTANSISSVNHC